MRWRVRSKTFAHVPVAQEGYTSAYRDMTGVTEPTSVRTFRSSDWDEVVELVTESYRFCAPQKPRRRLDR